MTTDGKFVWYDIMTTDAQAAAAFYAGVIGLAARDAGMPDMTYNLLSSNGVDVAGVGELSAEMRQAGAPILWIGYVAVADVDTSAARAAETGGTIHLPPHDIPGVGRFAILGDPQEAGFAIFTPASTDDPSPADMSAPGHVGWHELVADDWEAAFDFYAGLFDWTKSDAMDMGPMGTYQLFGCGDVPMIGGMMNRSETVPAPRWRYYFNVDAIDATLERIGAGGGELKGEPIEVPGGSWVFNSRDPQGAAFAVIAPKR